MSFSLVDTEYGSLLYWKISELCSNDCWEFLQHKQYDTFDLIFYDSIIKRV